MSNNPHAFYILGGTLYSEVLLGNLRKGLSDTSKNRFGELTRAQDHPERGALRRCSVLDRLAAALVPGRLWAGDLKTAADELRAIELVAAGERRLLLSTMSPNQAGAPALATWPPDLAAWRAGSITSTPRLTLRATLATSSRSSACGGSATLRPRGSRRPSSSGSSGTGLH